MSMQFQNVSDVKICLMQEKCVKPEYPDLANKHMPMRNRSGISTWPKLWRLGVYLKEIYGTCLPCLRHSVTPRLRAKLKQIAEYKTLEMTLDSMGLLSVIKRLVYTGGTNNLNVWHNKAIAIMPNVTISGEISRYTRVQRSIHGNEKSMWWTGNKIRQVWRWCKGNAC